MHVFHAVGPALREIRQEQGLKQITVCEKSGYAPGYLSRIENNQSKCNLRALVCFAEAIGVKASDVLLRAESKSNE